MDYLKARRKLHEDGAEKFGTNWLLINQRIAHHASFNDLNLQDEKVGYYCSLIAKYCLMIYGYVPRTPEKDILTQENARDVLLTAFYEIEKWKFKEQNIELTFEEYKNGMSASSDLWDADFISKLLIEKGYRIVKVGD